MGLRINTNITALRSLRNLSINDRNQAKSLERLSTGMRINRGSDDPSGLVISEQLKAQLAAMNQAVDNSQNASNLISIADAALAEVSNILVSIQDSIVFSQNTGGNSPEQIAAEQDSVDQAIDAIDRISATTRYSEKNLLNGNSGYVTTGTVPDLIDDLDIKSLSFSSTQTSRTLTVNVDNDPQRARVQMTGVSVSGTTTLRIQGGRGTENIQMASGSTAASIASAINAKAGFTGVYASSAGGDVNVFSESFGSDALVKFEVLGGRMSGSALTALDDAGAMSAIPSTTFPLNSGTSVTDKGRDGVVNIDGIQYTGNGRDFNILTSTSQFTFSLDPEMIGISSGGSFTVLNSGMTFQLNSEALQTDRLQVGIRSVASSSLGSEASRDRISESINGISAGAAVASQILQGGYLSSLVTGGGNDLTEDPDNASRIVGRAIDQVSTLRGFLGAVQASNIQPNIDSLGVSIENLSASLSDLQDLDFAKETTNFTKTQILFQSGIAVLASANLIPQSVLSLLG